MLHLFNNNLSITADYFNKSVEGLLFTDAPPLYAGTSEPVKSNIGSTESKGVDLTLGYKIMEMILNSIPH